MDSDNDRLLKKEDFELSLSPILAHADLSHAVFTAFDCDDNGAIDYKEYVRYVTRLSTQSSLPL